MQVTVIGAGIIGCATAYELSRRGANVTLIDMRHPGGGATNASAGVLAPYIETHSSSFLQLGTSSLSMYDEFVERLRRDSGYEIEYQREGSIEVALTDEQYERLRLRADGYAAAGVDHRMLDAAEVLDLEPTLTESVAGGLFVPSHGFVSARHLTTALAAAAEGCGAALAADCQIDRVSFDDVHMVAHAQRRTFDADVVVLAAGSWSGRIVIEAAPVPPVKPIRGQLLQLSSPSPVARRVLWGTNCYVVPWRDGTVLVGATTEDVGFDERATVAGVRDLLDSACEMLPAAWNVRFNEVRVGLRPSTSDGLPIIGTAAAAPNVIFATGHYRNGVLLAPLTAVAVADLILAGAARPELALTSPARFGL